MFGLLGRFGPRPRPLARCGDTSWSKRTHAARRRRGCLGADHRDRLESKRTHAICARFGAVVDSVFVATTPSARAVRTSDTSKRRTSPTRTKGIRASRHSLSIVAGETASACARLRLSTRGVRDDRWCRGSRGKSLLGTFACGVPHEVEKRRERVVWLLVHFQSPHAEPSRATAVKSATVGQSAWPAPAPTAPGHEDAACVSPDRCRSLAAKIRTVKLLTPSSLPFRAAQALASRWKVFAVAIDLQNVDAPVSVRDFG